MIARDKTKPAQNAQSGIDILQGHPVFGDLPLPQIKRLAALAHTRMTKRGETIFSKGDQGNALYAVATGTVKITVPSSDGREAMFNLVQEGEIFGEIALLDGRPRTADAVSMTDCSLMVIKRTDFMDFIRNEPKVMLKLIELLCARLRWTSKHLEEIIFLDLPGRLAKTILRLAEGKKATKDQKLSITQNEISQLIGMTRESSNRQLRAWAKRKWIRLDRGSIVVLAPDALAKIAGAGFDGEA